MHRMAKDQRGGEPSAWCPYSSIESYDNEKCLNRIRSRSENCEWIATEKVHGANFSFETDGQRVSYASRSNKLGNGADFFNARATMPKYHPYVLAAFDLARKHARNLKQLVIYGEYFGGYYPGHPVEPGLKKVQGGVAYSPGHHFYAFDVMLNGEAFMDFDAARELLLAAGFPLVAAPLRRGSFEDVLSIDVEKLETTIPAQLGHPVADRFRIAEGVVIRPDRERGQTTGRRMLKKKSRAFWEATNQQGMLFKSADASNDVEVLVAAARDLVNENRLRAVISKDPRLLQEAQVPKLAGLFTKDALEELEKRHEDEMRALGKDAGLVKKATQYHAKAFVEKHVAAIREDVG